MTDAAFTMTRPNTDRGTGGIRLVQGGRQRCPVTLSRRRRRLLGGLGACKPTIPARRRALNAEADRSAFVPRPDHP